MYGDLYPALEYDTEEFHCPKNPLCSPCSFLPPPNSLEATDHITVCVVLSFPEGRRVRIAHHIACSDWLLPPSNMRLNFPQVFLRLIAHFCLLPIIFHCLDILAMCKFLQVWRKLLHTLVDRFLCGHQFSLIWVSSNNFGILLFFNFSMLFCFNVFFL